MDVMMSYANYVKVTNYLREMLCQVCDHAHDRCVKLLVARARVRTISVETLHYCKLQ